MKNWRRMITKAPENNNDTPHDFKNKPLFTPTFHYYRHDYTPRESYEGLAYRMCEALPADINAAMIRNKFLPGTQHTRVGISYCYSYTALPNEPYVQNINALNNNTYTRTIGNLFDVITLYFIEERGVNTEYVTLRISVWPIIEELETNPQFKDLWYERTTESHIVTSHNLNTYFGEYVKGDKVDIKGNFNIGITPDKIATLNNTQIIANEVNNNCCRWYTLRRQTYTNSQAFFVRSKPTLDIEKGGDPINLIIDNDKSHLTHFEYYPGRFEDAWYYYNWADRYEAQLIWYPYHPGHTYNDYLILRNYPVWFKYTSFVPGDANHDWDVKGFVLNLVQIAVPKNSRSKITERNIF